MYNRNRNRERSNKSLKQKADMGEWVDPTNFLNKTESGKVAILY